MNPRFYQTAIVLLAGWLMLVGISLAHADGIAQPKLTTVTLDVGGKSLKTELAISGNQRFMGLSFRKTLADDEAMLFVYQQERPLVFTMRNTLLPLSIAYISEDLVINEILDMPVGPDQLFPSSQPAKYALEVNMGWFERNNVKVGSKIRMR